jgi:carbamoyltransferase
VDILGISFGVDTAACLLRDGAVVGAVLEERFSRIKHDRGWPSQSIDWVLKKGGTSLAEIEHVAFFWNPALHLDFAHPGRARTYRHHGDYLHMAPAWLLGALRGPLGGIDSPSMTQTIRLERRAPLHIHYVTHHRTHAAAAFLPSPFPSAAILTVDGFGERACTTMGRWAEGGTYESLGELAYPQSLGAVYAAVTGFLGFRPNNGEGKVMGLAPYGTDRLADAFREIIRVNDDPGGDAPPYDIDLSWFEYYLDTPRRVSARFRERFGDGARAGQTHDQHHHDIARGLQTVVQEALLACARRVHARSGEKHLVMAGGVAMNSVANGFLEREGPFESIWVQPSSGDGGTSVGAALWAEHALLGGASRVPWTNDRFGPAYDRDECVAALRRGGWTWHEPDNVFTDTAAAIAAGELIGWFQGRAELGARALGGRSILADPRRPENKDVLNARVKYREPFRPFAPSVIEEAANDLFELDLPGRGTATVPSMQKVFDVRPAARPSLGAITHVDGSARLQTVSATGSPRYHAVISAFGEITGVPVLLNTSFNVKGEPMVLTPDDAIRCWASTGLDRLVLGDLVLRKHVPGPNQ